MGRQRSGLSVHRRAYSYCDYSKEYTLPPSPPQIVTDRLLLHFEAGDSTSYSGTGDTWVNIGTGGTQFNATLLGNQLPTFVTETGLIKSFHFNQNNLLINQYAYTDFNYMRVQRPSSIGDSFTYCAWINTTFTGYGTTHYKLMCIISTETSGVNNDFGFGVDSSGNLAYGDGIAGGADITIRTTTRVNTGLWTFVAVTRDKSSGTVKLYINGNLETTGQCNVGNTLGNATYLLIGSASDFPTKTFGGNIGGLLGNTIVLTPAQILTNYKAQKSIYGL